MAVSTIQTQWPDPMISVSPTKAVAASVAHPTKPFDKSFCSVDTLPKADMPGQVYVYK